MEGDARIGVTGMRIVVTASTGHIGHRVVEHLLAAKADVTVFVRHPKKLPDAVRELVRVERGELEDVDALTRAFKSAERAFVLVPPNMTASDWAEWHRRVGRHYGEALAVNDVRHAVMISSFGAGQPHLGPITYLGDVEESIQAATPNAMILRCGYFMENLLQFVPTLRESSVMYNPIPPTTPLPMVATRDTADVAAMKLLDRSWSGHRFLGVLGPRDVTMTEAAVAIGRALERPVTYAQVPLEAAVDAMRKMGMSDDVAEGYGEMLRGLSTPGIGAEPRTAESTTPTTIEEFARTVIRPAVLAPEPARA
jgi:uncharacterized protein YbjT (DUF2867 family)